MGVCFFFKSLVKNWNQDWLKRRLQRQKRRLHLWLLDVEMGFVWGVASISVLTFIFASIWYIDPALLTLMLRFRQAECRTREATFSRGISNCNWTSCKLGCTKDVYQCWKIKVEYVFDRSSKTLLPPWATDISSAKLFSEEKTFSRLFPNARGCGYPPELNCENFFSKYGMGKNGTLNDVPFTCWVATMDKSIAVTNLNMEQAKEEVLLSLVPFFVFISFIFYAFCRLGVFSQCKPTLPCIGNLKGLPREKSKLKDFGTQRHGSFQLVPTEEMPMEMADINRTDPEINISSNVMVQGEI